MADSRLATPGWPRIVGSECTVGRERLRCVVIWWLSLPSFCVRLYEWKLEKQDFEGKWKDHVWLENLFVRGVFRFIPCFNKNNRSKRNWRWKAWKLIKSVKFYNILVKDRIEVASKMWYFLIGLFAISDVVVVTSNGMPYWSNFRIFVLVLKQKIVFFCENKKSNVFVRTLKYIYE